VLARNPQVDGLGALKCGLHAVALFHVLHQVVRGVESAVGSNVPAVILISGEDIE
jgi:hypothetical protein